MLSLKQFASISVCAFGVSAGMAYWEVTQALPNATWISDEFTEEFLLHIFRSKLRTICTFMMALSVLLVVGKIIQLIFFGKLRGEESRVG